MAYIKIHCADCGVVREIHKYMPDGADVSVWQEITDAKKQELEAQWQAESEVVDVTE